MTPAAFTEKWSDSRLRERQGSQEHFIDLCRLLDEPTPAGADRVGDTTCFERGTTKVGGGDGWADVWRKGRFGWGYKGRHKGPNAALCQPQTYAPDLQNPPISWCPTWSGSSSSRPGRTRFAARSRAASTICASPPGARCARRHRADHDHRDVHVRRGAHVRRRARGTPRRCTRDRSHRRRGLVLMRLGLGVAIRMVEEVSIDPAFFATIEAGCHLTIGSFPAIHGAQIPVVVTHATPVRLVRASADRALRPLTSTRPR